MPKKSSRHNDELFRQTFEEGFKKHYQNGLLQGARAMCKVISDKAADASKQPQERIDDIIRFCSVMLGVEIVPNKEGTDEATKTDQPE